MDLTTLLAELRENMLHDRSDAVSGQSDRLWTDATLVRYINEAHKRFARDSLCIRDATTAAQTEVAMVTDQEEYALSAKVIGVISAKVVGEDGDLVRTGHNALSAYQAPDPFYFDVNNLADSSGKPLAFSTDEGFGADGTQIVTPTLKLYPKPSSTYNAVNVKLRVVRLPLTDFSTGAMSAEPEIPEEHHLDMLDWAAYLALRIADDDAGNQRLAERYAASFATHTADARKLAMRRMFVPHQWGFGRAGFSWEH